MLLLKYDGRIYRNRLVAVKIARDKQQVGLILQLLEESCALSFNFTVFQIVSGRACVAISWEYSRLALLNFTGEV